MTKDEGIRPSTTLEGLSKLKPAFKEGGTTTAGWSQLVQFLKIIQSVLYTASLGSIPLQLTKMC